MRVNGEIIKCTVKELLNGLTAEYTLEIMSKIKSMGLEKLSGQMEKFTKANGEKEFKMEKVK
jgi:hypothetical protein